MIVFTVEDHRYALDLSFIERVVRAVEVTPLPRAPEMVIGVINMQGRILPVLDIRKRLGCSESVVSVSDRFIIVRLPRKTVAFVVDTVVGVMECRAEEMTSAENILSGIESIEGVFNVGGGMILVHDPVHFLSSEEEKVLDDVAKQV